MKRYIALFICMISLTAAAQQPPAKPAQPAVPAVVAPLPPAPPTPPADPEAGGQSTNIRLDVTVTDQTAQGGNQPKSIMVMLVDRAMGQTRASFPDRSIAVDARPTITDGRIRLLVTIQSGNAQPHPGPQPDPTLNWRNSFSLLLENGKPMVALETSDAVTKRKLSIEVKATIQK